MQLGLLNMLSVLKKESFTRNPVIMSEVAVLASSVKTRIQEIAKQAMALASGLQNAAPGEKDIPNASIQYLLAVSDALNEISEQLEMLEQQGYTARQRPPSS